MKKLYFLVVVVFVVGSVRGQNPDDIVVIPDTNFKNRLLQSSTTSSIALNIAYDRIKIDANNDGEFQVSELQNVYKLSVSISSDITDLTGIEYFTNLKSLTVAFCPVVSLDVSMLNNLQELVLRSTDLENLLLGAANSSLKNLDITGSNLTTIDVSGIATLEDINCKNNDSLISLDTSGCIALETIDCIENINLASLNAQGCIELYYLECFENKLSSLNVGGCINLETIICNNNILTSLDLSGLIKLEHISCESNQLTDLIFSNNPVLRTVVCRTNQFSTLDLNGAPNIYHLDCTYNQLESIVGLSNLTELVYFYCYHNNLTTLNLAGANSLKSFDCSNNQLNTLNGLEGLLHLESLSTNNNALTTLNVLGNSNLKGLDCEANQIATIDLSGLSMLEYLNLSNNALNSLTLTGLQALKTVECENNLLTSLSFDGLNSLKKINCKSNLIASLDLIGLNVLERVDCSYNNMTALSFSAPTSLLNFNCSNNSLLAIDFPEQGSIEKFDCSFNQLISLDLSTLCIRNLYCNNNQLTSLLLNCAKGELDCSNNQLNVLEIPVPASFMGYEQGMVNINCSNNVLESLTLPENSDYPVNSINCNNNNLTSLFVKNNHWYGIVNTTFEGNPDLQYICADEIEIDFLDELAISYGYNTEVNSYCFFSLGNNFNYIEGVTRTDIDNNGCDADDLIFPFLKFDISNGATEDTFISDYTGYYSTPIPNGVYTIQPIFENSTYFTVDPEIAELYFFENGETKTQDFCITPNGIHPDLEVAILPTTPARPGFDAEYKIIIKNKGNIQQSGSVSFAYDDTVLDYIIAEPLFTTQAEGSLSWAFADLQPFETREINVTLNVNSPMETPAVNGDDVLTYTATITSEATDELPLDNIFSLPQIVVNSFDPNDKTCLEGTAITPDMIGKYVHYMIRFENTGTFAAQNIVVKDMIDTTKFDVSSLIALSGSHPYVTRINGNKVEFIFEGINLPFEDATNDGYVVFKIKTLPTLALGDSFSNTASIYFDFNHPIVTEPAVTTFAVLGTEDFVFNSYFTLYPNPTNGILNITSKQAIELQSISIYNVLGQMVVSVPNAKGVNSVDVSSLSTGNYFIKVVSDKGTSNTKFIKK